jgi:2-oxoglutarate ferredoxin oxidoreductase subunit alpha
VDFKDLERELILIKENSQKNLEEAKKGYEQAKEFIMKIKDRKENLFLKNGNKGISEGAIKSGIDIYYAYPMTPATGVLNELAEIQYNKNILVLELEMQLRL